MAQWGAGTGGCGHGVVDIADELACVSPFCTDVWIHCDRLVILAVGSARSVATRYQT